MAIIQSHLFLDDCDYPFHLIHFDTDIYQSINTQNLPVDEPKGGIINLIVGMPDAGDKMPYFPLEVLVAWAASTTTMKNGLIDVIDNKLPSSTSLQIAFSNAFCIKYRLAYDTDSTDRPSAISHVTLSAQSIHFGSNPHCRIQNKWPGITPAADTGSTREKKRSYDLSE